MDERMAREPVPAPARDGGDSSLREISSRVVSAAGGCDGCTLYFFTPDRYLDIGQGNSRGSHGVKVWILDGCIWGDAVVIFIFLDAPLSYVPISVTHTQT